MEKEQILELNRKDNKGNDEYESHVLGQASTIATIVGGVFCIIFTLVDFIVSKNISTSYWAIYFGMLFVEFLIKAIRLKRKALTLFSIFYGLLMIGATIIYFLQIFEVLA